MTAKFLQAFLYPALIFGFAYLSAPYQHYLPESISELFQSPFWALSIVVLLAGFFDRGKVFLAAVLLSIGLFYKSGVADGTFIDHHLYFAGVGILIPINLAIISVFREPGVLKRPGLFQLIYIAGQVIAIYVLTDPDLAVPVGWIHYPIVSLDIWPVYLPPSQLVFLLSVLSLLVVLVTTLTTPSLISYGVLGATIGYCLTIWMALPIHTEGAFFIASALLLTLGLLRNYRNMAYTDELTGLPQRRALEKEMMTLGRDYSLAMLDVDHFKKFNDTHGHDVGDQVLKLMASQIGKVKGGGKAFRYGGEEFTIVFAGLDIEESAIHLNEIRRSIANYNFVLRDKNRKLASTAESRESRESGSFTKAKNTVSITISIGVSSRQARSEKPKDVLKRADQALYRAKGAGRNCVRGLVQGTSQAAG